MSLYGVLGIPHDASADEIHRAYRELARRLHPDTGSSETAQMATVNDAWQVLGDPARRAAYDATITDLGRRDIGGMGHDAAAVGERVPLPRNLRLLVVCALAMALVVSIAIMLIGFGRVGASP